MRVADDTFAPEVTFPEYIIGTAYPDDDEYESGFFVVRLVEPQLIVSMVPVGNGWETAGVKCLSKLPPLSALEMAKIMRECAEAFRNYMDTLDDEDEDD